MGHIYKTQFVSGNKPKWYWDKSGGFHDAKITNVKEYILDYDNTESNSIRNYYEVELNLVKNHHIRFYNCKIIKGFFEIDNWWLCDTLSEKNNKFFLDIIVCNNEGKEHLVSLKFDYAEVM